MATFINGEEARLCGRGNSIITEEILLLNRYIIDAVASEALSVTIDATTTTTVNGITITGTTMTNADSAGQAYYDAWTEAVDNERLTEQMEQVILYFERNQFAIARSSTTGTEITWTLSW